MNWTDGTFNQEQAHCLFLSGHSAPAAATIRPKFHVRDCHFQNGVADGLSMYVNVDVIAENITADTVFRGGVVATGGNSIVNLRGYRGENARMDLEIDGAGYGGTLRSDISVEDADVDKLTGGGRWANFGGIDIGSTNGGRFIGRNIRTYSPPFNYDAEGGGERRFTDCRFTLGNDTGSANRFTSPESGVFTACHFYVKRVAGASAYSAVRVYPFGSGVTAATPLRFDRCTFELDPAIEANEPSATCWVSYLDPHAAAYPHSYYFKDCEQIGAWDKGYVVANGGTITIDGGIHTAVEFSYTISTSGFPAKWTLRNHHEMKPTVSRLFEQVGQAAQTGTFKLYDNVSFSRAVNGGEANDTLYTVMGDGYRFPVDARPNLGAVRGSRAIRNIAGLNDTSALAVLEWVAENTHYNNSTWRPIRWVTRKGTTAARPVLNADDIGVNYLDTTLDADGKMIWWNGVAWVDATGATV
jgi:hypothetical protein